MQKFPFETILMWYQNSQRQGLPWREYHYDAKTLGYRVWLSETMLQQTQVSRVKRYFSHILEAFPTVEDLACSDYEEFFPYYKGLGYYSRARNMLLAAKIVAERFGGVFPKQTAELQTLPGVGVYTAEAIRAFAYNIPTMCFDTNLEKIFSRYYYADGSKKLSKKDKEDLKKQCEKLCMSSSKSSSYLKSGYNTARNINNALMDFGALVSLKNPENIDWSQYPLHECQFYMSRGTREEKKHKQTPLFPNKQAYILAILHENHKIYFSPLADFIPFFIGNYTGNPRKHIQQYFLTQYHLELSIRPPEIKSYDQHGMAYMICYCQIQSGNHDFHVFENMKVRGFEEGYVEKYVGKYHQGAPLIGE